MCKAKAMRTNVDIDDELIEKVKKAAKLRTKKEVIHFALNEAIRNLNMKKLAELKGKINWKGDLAEMRTSKWIR
ncbi:MAG: type II toxin-antitoxin system VapB family antitoxin [Chitinophagales bacterium]